MQVTVNRRGEGGFSLIELLISMAVTLLIMGMASGLLARSMGVRSRENGRLEALGSAQRALNIMTREIANSGAGLRGNGIVAADSNAQRIRVRANTDAFVAGVAGSSATDDEGEDVVFGLQNTGTQTVLTRFDVNTNNVSSLAGRINPNNFVIEYLGANGAAVAPDAAVRVRLTIGVILPAVGNRNAPGYQPESRTRVSSEIVLRNANLQTY